jgi:hypothetical protein
VSDADLDRSIGFIQLNAISVKIASIAERSDAAPVSFGALSYALFFLA